MKNEIPLLSRHTVDRLPGIKVECGTTSCVIEMIAYKFIGKLLDVHRPIAALPLNPGTPTLLYNYCLFIVLYVGHSVSMPPRLDTLTTTLQEDATSDSTIRTDSIDSGNFSPLATEPVRSLNEPQPAAPRSQMNLNAEEIVRAPDKNKMSEQEPHSRQN